MKNKMLKGKPSEREGRKASDLSLMLRYDSGVARLRTIIACLLLLGSGLLYYA